MARVSGRGAQASKKRWIKGVVLVVGVADCVGLYYAQQRLNAPVPDSVRYDRTAFTIPESSNRFHVNGPMLADAAPSKVAPPVLAVPQLASPAQPMAEARLARAEAATVVPAAAAPAPRAAASKLAVAATPKAAAPAPKLAAAPKPAPAPAARAPIVTPHLAKVEKPAPGFHSVAATKALAVLTSAKQTASLAVDASAHDRVVKTVSVKGSTAKAHAPSSSLATLVPKARKHSEFALAFAGLDAPQDSAAPVELGLPTIEPAQIAAPQTDFAANGGPVLENVLPAPAAELPPVSAAADMPEAKL